MKILVIEDRPEVAALLKRCLSAVGTVLLAYTMQEALEFLETKSPLDLITVDLGLPDSHPQETIEKLAEIRAKNPDAVVIVITGMVTREHEQNILKAGADGFLHKQDVPTQLTLFQRIMQIARSIVSAPERFKRNIAVAELMAAKLTEYVCSQTDSPNRSDIHCSLQ